MAPHGVYPTAGDDAWVAIACPDDAAWQRLAGLLDGEPWARDPELETTAGRLARVEVLDARLAEWTAGRDRWEVAEALQAAGIPAAPLLTSADRVSDSHFASREAFTIVEHPVVGAELIYGLPWKLSRTPGVVRTAAPLLGAHTAEVLEEYLGVPSREVEKGTAV
jgi:crotonobetainyl-CoA:carnitine CoA-transferase CaiB-like acyl-CoA transferase